MVKIFGGIEPEMELNFPTNNVPISTPSDVHICLKNIRLPFRRAQELDVDLIVVSRVIFAVRKLPFFTILIVTFRKIK